MARQQTVPEQHYDPLWGDGRKKKLGGRGTKIAIALSIGVHAGLFYYLYQNKFVVHYQTYNDNALIAELVRPVRPPPPPQEPPKAPPLKREPAPAPEFAPRTPVLAPNVFFDGPTIPAPVLEPVAPPQPEPVAQEAPKPVQKTIVNPDWSSQPSGDDVARYYPERAQRLEQPGKVTLQCQVTAKGTVTACSVLSEDPMGWNFGEAALKLSRLFKMKPKMEDGQAVEGAMVKIPIAFRIG